MGSLQFLEFVCLDKHQFDLCFELKLWIPKNPFEHVRSCIVLEEKGNTPKDSWCSGFMSKDCAHSVICLKHQQKWRHIVNTGKHMILLTRKTHLTEKVLCHYKSNYQQDWNKLKQNKKHCRHDQEVVIFWHNMNRLHSPTLVKFPFGQPPYKSFCRKVGLCWGS
jgi:hypothetical protein